MVYRSRIYAAGEVENRSPRTNCLDRGRALSIIRQNLKWGLAAIVTLFCIVVVGYQLAHGCTISQISLSLGSFSSAFSCPSPKPTPAQSRGSTPMEEQTFEGDVTFVPTTSSATARVALPKDAEIVRVHSFFQSNGGPTGESWHEGDDPNGTIGWSKWTGRSQRKATTSS
jgi:hypothetical protein